jgi:hypothetical protein
MGMIPLSPFPLFCKTTPPKTPVYKQESRISLPLEQGDVYLGYQKPLKFGQFRTRRVEGPARRAQRLRHEASMVSIAAHKKKKTIAPKIADDASLDSSIARSEKRRAEKSLLKKRIISPVKHVETRSGRVVAIENPLYRQVNESFIDHAEAAQYREQRAGTKRREYLDILEEASEDFAIADKKRAEARRIEDAAIRESQRANYATYTHTRSAPQAYAADIPATPTFQTSIPTTMPHQYYDYGNVRVDVDTSGVHYEHSQNNGYSQAHTPVTPEPTYYPKPRNSEMSGLSRLRGGRILEWQSYVPEAKDDAYRAPPKKSKIRRFWDWSRW